MYFLHEILKIQSYMSPIKNSILGIKSPCFGPLFKPISFSNQILRQNFDFWILDFYAIFWLDPKVANLGQIRVFAKSYNFVKMALNTKVIYETLVNSIALNKVSLQCIWFWDTLYLQYREYTRYRYIGYDLRGRNCLLYTSPSPRDS